MSQPEFAWRAEIQAHVPEGCDRIEVAEAFPELFEWRSMLCEDPELRACVAEWEGYIQARKLAVPIEQATEDGAIPTWEEINLRLRGCPTESRAPLVHFLKCAPEAVREYLAYAAYCLVQIERQRRTGSASWHSQAASGSPEVLQELMFKWGPRFRRHRWTW